MSIKRALEVFEKFASFNETDHLKLKLKQYYLKLSDLHAKIDILYELSEGKQTEEIIKAKSAIKELGMKIADIRLMLKQY